MSLASYLAFCVAAFALAVVPGPTVTVIIANALRYGARAGMLNVTGSTNPVTPLPSALPGVGVVK